MKEQKEFLREKLIEFQTRIADLNRAVRERNETGKAEEQKFYLGIFEVVDALDSLAENLRRREEQLGKTGRMLAKSIGSIHRRLAGLLESRGKTEILFPDNKATMEHCKIISTQEAEGMEDETILSVVKKGYVDTQHNTVLRKAEVITVRNT